MCLTFSKAPHSLGIPIHQIHFSSLTLTGLEPLHPYWKLFGVEWTQMHEGGRYICRASIRARGKVGARGGTGQPVRALLFRVLENLSLSPPTPFVRHETWRNCIAF